MSAMYIHSGVEYSHLGYTQLQPCGDSLGIHNSGLLLIHLVCSCALIEASSFGKCINSGVDILRLAHTQLLPLMIHLACMIAAFW